MLIEAANQYSAQLFAIALVVLTVLIQHMLRLRPRIIYSVKHASNYPVEQTLQDVEGNAVQQVQIVRTASIVAQNTGREAATNVEFTFNYKPPIYTVWPGRAFTEAATGMGRWMVKLDSMAPGEQFMIEIMSINQDLPLLSSMRSDEIEGKLIAMIPQRQWPTWFNLLVGLLFLLGLGTVFYWAVRVIDYLAS